MEAKKIAVIGATGSIGASALDIFRQYPQEFSPVLLAGGGNWRKLAQAASEFEPAYVSIADERLFPQLKHALSGRNIKLYAGAAGLEEAIAECGAKMCLSAAVGAAGLRPTVAAINAGMDIALANKESLVAGGEIILRLVREKGVRLLPVDSEHSALFQCLDGSPLCEIRKLIITASGGAFRDFTKQQLQEVTPQQALAHPTWAMGAKITVDSATLANKALEVIEAQRLFEVEYDRIEVLVHRQSLIHGMVEFCDGSVLAQMASPDMRLPVLHALSYPRRLVSNLPGPSLWQLRQLTFEEPDHDRFPMLETGISAGRAGGLQPAVYSAANEKAVELFLAGKIRFAQIHPLVCRALAQALDLPVTLENIAQAELLAAEAVVSGALSGAAG